MQHTMAAAAAVQHLAVIHQQHCASPAGISAQGKLQLVPVSQVPAHQQAPKPAAGQVDPLPPDPYNCFTSRQLQILADHGISTADLQAMLLTAAQHPQAASSTAQAGAAAQTNVLQAKAHGSSSSYMQAPAGTGMDSSAQPLRPGACMNNMQGDCHVHVALATAQPAAAAPRKVQPMQKQAWLPASEVDALGALQGSGTLAELPMRQRPAGPHAAALAAMFLQSISTAAQAALNSRSRESTQNYKSAQHTASSQQLDLDLTLLNNNNSDINSSDDIDSPMSVMALQAYQAILNMAAQQAPLPDQVSTPPAGKPPAGPSNTKKRSQPSPSPGYDAGAAATVAGWDHMQYDASLQQGQGAATAKSGSTAYPARRKVVKKSQTGSVGDAGASPTGKSPAGQPESIFPPTERVSSAWCFLLLLLLKYSNNSCMSHVLSLNVMWHPYPPDAVSLHALTPAMCDTMYTRFLCCHAVDA